jgi:uncharacterized membrane protein (DUF4010 family)
VDNYFGPAELGVWRSMAEALMIGLLVGAQREGAHREEAGPASRAGLRDFILVAAIGGLCGLLQIPWLTVSALLGMVAMWVVFKQHQPQGVGLTTDLAAIAVFCLSYTCAVPGFPQGGPLAIALAIVLATFLEAKRTLHKFFRETITEVEFNDTLRFLTLIFIIYPLLPRGSYGPYQFLNPQRLWFFVILVSSISYMGYFLEKFLGEKTGLTLVSLLGGLASTTASTSAFAQEARRQPDQLNAYWQAATLANAIQFPRVLALLAAISLPLARSATKSLLVMGAAGLILAGLIRMKPSPEHDSRQRMSMRNPFTFRPALEFGVMFAAIMFFVKAMTFEFGNRAITWTSAISGLLDVDSITITTGELFKMGKLETGMATAAILLALLANAFFKTGMAWTLGTWSFAWRVGLSFLVMLGSGAMILALF